jgi:hypothetical protein
MPYVIVLLLLVAVVWVVSGPLRRGASAETGADREKVGDSMQRIDLEAGRDAKYREIRDAELDHQTGKLSDEDYEAIDSTLRAEAISLLHELDALDDADELDHAEQLDDAESLDDAERLDPEP